MRMLGLLLILASAGLPQDDAAKPPAKEAAANPVPADVPKVASAHDKFGFPITFNDEIITMNDVMRTLGGDPSKVPAVSIQNTRDKLIRDKVVERVAESLGIVVDEREVDELIQRQIDIEQGEAKYYESLSQKGSSLEQERLSVRRRILTQRLAFLFQSGVSYDRRKLMPARVRPTPREIQIAYRADPARRTAGLSVRRLEFEIACSKREAQKIIMDGIREAGGALDEAAMEKLIADALKPRIDAAVAKLKSGVPFADVAKENGADVEGQKEAWIKVPKGETKNAAERFFQTAKPGTYSAPIRQVGGGCRIVYLLERVNPSERRLTDEKVVEEYTTMIAALRAAKWQAIFEMRALDGSTVRPERVREEIRADLVAQLKDAESRLRALNLH